jgi:hypothetical protein
MKDTATATADRLEFSFCSGFIMVRSMPLRKIIHIDMDAFYASVVEATDGR